MLLLGLLLAIAGAILALAGSSWFAGATTVGAILIVGGAAMVIIPLIVFLLGAAFVNKRF